MNGEIAYDKDGKILNNVSAYQPSQEERDLYAFCKKDYENGDEILNRPFEEFNNKSVIGRMNEDQKSWLAWTPEASSDPEDAWRWNGVRPITRLRIMSTAAHATKTTLVPQVFAQNDADEEDRDMSYVAKTLLEYNINLRDYPITFFYGIISGLVNPVTFWEVEYTEAYQEILEGTNSEYTKKKVIDDILSGFQNHLHAPNEILISNPYQFDLQKQKVLIKRRKISYDEAEGLHGEHQNWGHVKPGINAVQSEDGLFYDVEDINSDMVEECTYYYRRLDRQVVFVNGIYLSNLNTEFNPFTHRTSKNKPKYQFVKFGSEPIDAKKFFYYKSLAAVMSNDQEAVDREWQMFFDASMLATYPPTIGMGGGKIDKSVVVPAMHTELGKDAKVEPLNIANPMAALAALREGERSINESSQDPQSSGVQSGPQKTRGEAVILQENAETNLGPITRIAGQMVKEIGELMLDDIFRYQTIGEMSEILGGIPKMKYKTFVLPNKTKGGKNVSEYIKFTDRFAGTKMSKREKRDEELKMYEENGDEKYVYEVNPALAARMNYLVSVDSDQLMKKNTAFERAFKLEIFDRAIANAEVLGLDVQKVGMDFLMEPLVKGEASKYFIKNGNEGMALGLITPQENQGKSMPSKLVKSVAMERALPV
jgi:hypothetical protein